MRFCSEAEMERTMKVQEVILRAMAKRITWWQAAEILGICARQMRRWKRRYEEYGYDGLYDRRRQRPLGEVRYKFLYVDGANFRVRINGVVQSFCAVLGVSEQNQCFEVLAVEMGDRERGDLWESVFASLLQRGLQAEAVELGIMDGLPGLEAMFKRLFAGRRRSVARSMPRPMPVGGCAPKSAKRSRKTSTRSSMPPARVRPVWPCLP